MKSFIGVSRRALFSALGVLPTLATLGSISVLAEAGIPVSSAGAGDLSPPNLPSWNDTASTNAIVAFGERVTKRGSPDFVPEAERIATFDNDGTLWAEQPLYFQVLFALDRVKTLAPQHPDVRGRTKELFACCCAATLRACSPVAKAQAIVPIVTATHTLRLPMEFNQIVTGLDRHRQASGHQAALYGDGLSADARTGQPTVFRANGFKTFIVSGGGIDFMRPWTERVYGIPPQNVVGSSGKVKFELRDGKPVLLRACRKSTSSTTALENLSVSMNTSAAFRLRHSATPMATCKCSNTRWEGAVRASPSSCITPTQNANGLFGRDTSSIGRLDKALDEAHAKGWTVVDMKNDWKTIFPFGNK